MNEITKLLHATQALIEATTNITVTAQAFRDAVSEFANRVELTSTLSDDDVPGLDDPGDALDPPISDDAMRELLSRAAGSFGVAKVREIILDECGGVQKKAADMTNRERNCVRAALELLGMERSK